MPSKMSGWSKSRAYDAYDAYAEVMHIQTSSSLVKPQIFPGLYHDNPTFLPEKKQSWSKSMNHPTLGLSNFDPFLLYPPKRWKNRWEVNHRPAGPARTRKPSPPNYLQRCRGNVPGLPKQGEFDRRGMIGTTILRETPLLHEEMINDG